MDIFVLNLEGSLDIDKYNFLLKSFDDETVIKISKFRNYCDSLRTLFGELLIRRYLIMNYGMEMGGIKFSRNEFGKPHLVPQLKIHFNISHSGNYVVCAIDETEIGVDIEIMRDININISKKIYSVVELEYTLKMKKNNQLQYFFSIWVLKESYVKAIGEGLSKNIKSITTTKENGSWIIYDNDVKVNWNINLISMDSRYKLAVCSRSSLQNMSITSVSKEDITNFFIN